MQVQRRPDKWGIEIRCDRDTWKSKRPGENMRKILSQNRIRSDHACDPKGEGVTCYMYHAIRERRNQK